MRCGTVGPNSLSTNDRGPAAATAEPTVVHNEFVTFALFAHTHTRLYARNTPPPHRPPTTPYIMYRIVTHYYIIRDTILYTCIRIIPLQLCAPLYYYYTSYIAIKRVYIYIYAVRATRFVAPSGPLRPKTAHGCAQPTESRGPARFTRPAAAVVIDGRPDRVVQFRYCRFDNSANCSYPYESREKLPIPPIPYTYTHKNI